MIQFHRLTDGLEVEVLVEGRIHLSCALVSGGYVDDCGVVDVGVARFVRCDSDLKMAQNNNNCWPSCSVP